MRVSRAVLIALSAVLVFGCAFAPVSITGSKDQTVSLVYGYIDMSNVKASIFNSDKVSYINMKQVRPVTEKPIKLCGVSSGAFWNDRLTPGVYEVLEFGRVERVPGATITRQYHLPEFSKNVTAFTVDKPGLYYIGSYKMAEGYYNPDGDTGSSYSLIKADTPSEKEVLEKLLPLSEGSRWEPLILKRIKELK